MAINFRKRKKVLPGVYLNFSKNGISTTIGPRGANINIGKNGTYLNTGIPGTGLYSRQKIGGNSSNPSFTPSNNFTSNFNKVYKIIPTSKSLEELRKHIEEARNERHKLVNEIQNQQRYTQKLERKLKNNQSGIWKIFAKKETIEKLREEVKEANEYLADLYKHYEESQANINIESDKEFQEQYLKVRDAYNNLSKSNKIWDIVSERASTETKSAAKSSIDRKEVRFTFDDIDFILSEHSAFHLENADGDNLYIYPAFILQLNHAGAITLIDLHELCFRFHRQRFLEEKSTTPSDTQVVDYTWAKVNKDGSPDKRFVGNYQIPVVEYGAFEFSTNSGLKEVYYISDVQLAENFANEFRKYLSLFTSFPEEFKTHKNIDKMNDNYVVDHDSLSNEDLDPLFEDAARLIVMYQEGSTALIQRKLKIGYNRAGRIIDQLEAVGIIGAFDGTRAREVLITDEHSLEKFLDNLKTRKPSSRSSEFSFEYYNLLKDFSTNAEHVRDSLIENDVLSAKFGLKATEIKISIPYLIIYELCQISYKITQNKIKETSLEATGLSLIANRLFVDSGTDFLEEGYSAVVDFYESGKLINVTNSVLEIGQSEAVKFNISAKDSELIWKDDLTKKLPILVALKHQDDTLFDKYCQFLYHFANIITKADSNVTTEEELLLKGIYKAIQNPLPQKENLTKVILNPAETLDEVLNELNSLIGLHEVKSEINTLLNFIKVQKAREQSGLKSSSLSYHIVFTGNPGTGKTTVARIVAKIYKHLGILTDGQLVETDRSGLVAEYVGQTAVKVNNTVNSALNGVLFIDEAYSLVGENKDDFGKEAVATLIKRMEDDRDKLVLILAGYTNEMSDFIDTNPGFKSRFNRYISFPDFLPSELFEIFESNCNKLDYQLTKEAKTKMIAIFENAYSTRDQSFGNGRFVRNIFEKVLEQQANRIAKESHLTKEILTTITEDDIIGISVSIYSHHN